MCVKYSEESEKCKFLYTFIIFSDIPSPEKVHTKEKNKEKIYIRADRNIARLVGRNRIFVKCCTECGEYLIKNFFIHRMKIPSSRRFGDFFECDLVDIRTHRDVFFIIEILTNSSCIEIRQE